MIISTEFHIIQRISEKEWSISLKTIKDHDLCGCFKFSNKNLAVFTRDNHFISQYIPLNDIVLSRKTKMILPLANSFGNRNAAFNGELISAEQREFAMNNLYEVNSHIAVTHGSLGHLEPCRIQGQEGVQSSFDFDAPKCYTVFFCLTTW